MHSLMNFILDPAGVNRQVEDRPTKYWFVVPIVIVALALAFTAQAWSAQRLTFFLTPASDTIAACLPNATAAVAVFPKEDVRGVDTLDLKAQGLAPRTSFSVFLTELPEAPFGAAQYIGDLETNAAGKGSIRVDSIIDDAFSTTVAGGVRVRKDLNHVVLWFSDPAADDFCFAPGTGVITPFDGDGQAGVSAVSSRTSLPGAPLP